MKIESFEVIDNMFSPILIFPLLWLGGGSASAVFICKLSFTDVVSYFKMSCFVLYVIMQES